MATVGLLSSSTASFTTVLQAVLLNIARPRVKEDICTHCGIHSQIVILQNCVQFAFLTWLISSKYQRLNYSCEVACFATSIIGFYLEQWLCLFKWVEIILMDVTSTTGIIRFLCTLFFHHLKQVILVSTAWKRFWFTTRQVFADMMGLQYNI